MQHQTKLAPQKGGHPGLTDADQLGWVWMVPGRLNGSMLMLPVLSCSCCLFSAAWRHCYGLGSVERWPRGATLLVPCSRRVFKASLASCSRCLRAEGPTKHTYRRLGRWTAGEGATGGKPRGYLIPSERVLKTSARMFHIARGMNRGDGVPLVWFCHWTFRVWPVTFTCMWYPLRSAIKFCVILFIRVLSTI